MANDTVNRFLGGSPLAVLGRLILLSILIGFVLHAFGFNPFFGHWHHFPQAHGPEQFAARKVCVANEMK